MNTPILPATILPTPAAPQPPELGLQRPGDVPKVTVVFELPSAVFHALGRAEVVRRLSSFSRRLIIISQLEGGQP
jgi:hypothetical protein